MDAVLDAVKHVTTLVDSVIWNEYVLFFILGTGILFTIWSRFCQYRAMTHGVQVVRGRYDDKSDPGAINHLQALSAALSATVGLGNIGGVAGAIALGGPGAVFWMWIIGIIGMALKTFEVSLAMMFRNTDDPENPHGGAMWVADRAFPLMSPKLATFGKIVGVLFCITLLISSITGGNMYQAWNVAEITQKSFAVPRIVCGVGLSILCGMVIIGGIKSIGRVAGFLVPFMCLIYMAAGIVVILIKITVIPEMFALIFESAFSEKKAGGAFLGATFYYGFSWGMRRALFSNEAGQGSAPIAHAAAKTDEPIREGIVAGLGPFIDTLVVCTITALIILSTGAWNRAPDVHLQQSNFPASFLTELQDTKAKEKLILKLPEREEFSSNPDKWKPGARTFFVVEAQTDANTNRKLHRVSGDVKRGFLEKDEEEQFWVELGANESKAEDPVLYVVWERKKFEESPKFHFEDEGIPLYIDYPSVTLTGHAFDLVIPGLGKWMIPIAAWLFALSTMISWSYYGEQGVIYMFGSNPYMVTFYRIVYCLLIVVATLGIVKNDEDLGLYTSLGTGVMLVVNLPICLIFGNRAMKAYFEYVRKLKAGEFRKNW